MIKPNKTSRANSIRIRGNKNKKEHFNECNNMEFHDLTAHDKPTMDEKNIIRTRSKIRHANKKSTVERHK